MEWNSQVNCLKRIALFGLLLIICAFIYARLDFNLASINMSMSNGRNGSIAERRNVTNSTDIAYNSTNVQHNNGTKDQKRERLFRCPKPIGRMGNMMFQLAATIGIANTLGYTPYIAPSHELEKYFDTGIARNIKATNEITFNEAKCRNRTWNYNKDYLSHNLTTWGYLQSWKYFENSSNEVRKAFTFREIYINEARTFLRFHTKPAHILIGIHIRRGDFLIARHASVGFTVADGNYIRRAMEWYRRKSDKCLFVVVSDDKRWCRDNIKGGDVIYSHYEKGIIDMAILSLCHHSIITGGSFGWWSGWLAGGNVIYLADFPRPGSLVFNNTETNENYYPPHWIGMRNGIS